MPLKSHTREAWTQLCLDDSVLCLRHSLSSGIPQEWLICQLAAFHRQWRALCPAPCPSHTPFRLRYHIHHMHHLQDKILSSHQRETESSIQMNNCSRRTARKKQPLMHSHIHMPCFPITRRWLAWWPNSKRQSVHFTNIGSSQLMQRLNSLTIGLISAGSHSREEEYDKGHKKGCWLVRYLNQTVTTHFSASTWSTEKLDRKEPEGYLHITTIESNFPSVPNQKLKRQTINTYLLIWNEKKNTESKVSFSLRL